MEYLIQAQSFWQIILFADNLRSLTVGLMHPVYNEKHTN